MPFLLLKDTAISDTAAHGLCNVLLPMNPLRLRFTNSVVVVQPKVLHPTPPLALDPDEVWNAIVLSRVELGDIWPPSSNSFSASDCANTKSEGARDSHSYKYFLRSFPCFIR